MHQEFEQILGQAAVLTAADDLAHYGKDWCKNFIGKPSCVLLPKSVEEIQAVLKFCNRKGIAVVPSGGRTGLSAGATATNGEVVLSLDKLRKIKEINPIDQTLRCDAGVTLQSVQEAAQKAGFFYPVDLTPRGSCQIGGNIATNAGGIKVVKYGSTRDWVLGLKIVTAAGEIIEINGSLVKNQTGYDLKNLMIGSEGTLAIVVEALLKITKPPLAQTVMICGMQDFRKTLELFSQVRRSRLTMSAFECFTREGLELVISHHPLKDPLSKSFPCYALIEVEDESSIAEEGLSKIFESAQSQGLVGDGVISQNSNQLRDFWALRELIGETASTRRVPHKNDLSVPVHRIPDFVDGINALVKSDFPDFGVLLFGHVGDGNLHLNILKPDNMQREDFFKFCKEADKKTFTLVSKLGGSVSAEHGIGLLKKDYLIYTRSTTEIASMRQIKRVFDPNNILNPGKIFDA